jgi:hypothetical protein
MLSQANQTHSKSIVSTDPLTRDPDEKPDGDNTNVTITISISTADITCPITHQIFFDPVCVESKPANNKEGESCRHYFERSGITQWMKNNANCPCCRQPIVEIRDPDTIFKRNFESALKQNPNLHNERYYDLSLLINAFVSNNTKLLNKFISLFEASSILFNRASDDEKYLPGITAVTIFSFYKTGLDNLYKNKKLRNSILSKGLNAVIQDGPSKGTSAVFWLAITQDGRKILVEDPILRDKITAEGLNAIALDGAIKSTSALSWLAATSEGQRILVEDKILRDKITAEALNAVEVNEPHKGKTAVYWLTVTSEGQKILAEDKILRDKITAEGLNAIALDGPHKGISAISLLLCADKGREILLQDNARLLMMISTDTLTQSIIPRNQEHSGKSIAFWLQNTMEGKHILKNHPILQNKIILQNKVSDEKTETVQSSNTASFFAATPALSPNNKRKHPEEDTTPAATSTYNGCFVM